LGWSVCSRGNQLEFWWRFWWHWSDLIG
jgi:hypothetical protein